MGAAGLTSSSAEMAARGDVGVTIDTTKVPVREDGHDAVRDSAQRIAGAHARRRASAVAKTRSRAILEKWDLTAAVIGEVIAEPVYRVTEGDRVVAEFPGIRLVTDCPTYTPDARESDDDRRAARARRRRDRRAAGGDAIPLWTLERAALVADDREQDVGLSAVRHDGAHEHRRSARAATPRSCAFAAPIARSRSRPIATGATSISIRASARGSPSPRRRATSRAPARGRWRSRTISTSAIRSGPRSTSSSARPSRGMAEACEALGTPVTGGNVSLYNENPTRRGVSHAGHRHGRPHRVARAHHARRRSASAGDAIVLLGDTDRRARRRASTWRASTAWWPARRRACDLDAERALIDALLEAIQRRRRPVGARLQRRRPRRRARGVLHHGSRRADSARRSICGTGAICRRARCCSARRRRASSSRRRSPDARARDRRDARRAGARHRQRSSADRRSDRSFDGVDAHRRAARAARRRLPRNDSAHHVARRRVAAQARAQLVRPIVART